jgi:hypothetical protein
VLDVLAGILRFLSTHLTHRCAQELGEAVTPADVLWVINLPTRARQDIVSVFKTAAIKVCYIKQKDVYFPISFSNKLNNRQKNRRTDLDHGSYRLSNVEMGLTAGVAGQQEMLTPPWHLIPPLIYSEVRVRPFSDLYFL